MIKTKIKFSYQKQSIRETNKIEIDDPFVDIASDGMVRVENVIDLLKHKYTSLSKDCIVTEFKITIEQPLFKIS